MKAILQNWNFMRIIRLLLGLAILIQGIISNDFTSMILGIVFTAMPVFNIGCWGANSCAINNPFNTPTKTLKDEELDNEK